MVIVVADDDWRFNVPRSARTLAYSPAVAVNAPPAVIVAAPPAVIEASPPAIILVAKVDVVVIDSVAVKLMFFAFKLISPFVASIEISLVGV